jgi:prophage antirepressor-like protein
MKHFLADEKVLHQNALFLTEAGMIRLIFSSRKSRARPFQTWFLLVVKNIRKRKGKSERNNDKGGGDEAQGQASTLMIHTSVKRSSLPN